MTAPIVGTYVPHALVVFRGSLGPVGGAEDMWQIGLRFDQVGGGGGSGMLQVNVDKCRDAFRAMLVDAFARMSTAVSFEEARGTVIGSDGRAIGGPTISPAPVPSRAGASANLHPWSVSVAMTHDAGGARRGRFGRVYLPPMSLAVDATGRFELAQRDQILTAYKTFVKACEGPTEGGQELKLAVASKYGTLRHVTMLRCGDVPDTQRRRDNRLNEAYAVLPLP